MFFGGYGLYRARDHQNWWGWLLTGLASMIAIVAILSCHLGAMPWAWK